jgi:uncharacterized protein (TIGR02452 family)
MSLSGVAKETLQIIEAGSYLSPSGKTVQLGTHIAHAIAGTRLYRPTEANGPEVPAAPRGQRQNQSPVRIEVSDETTTQAARRLLTREATPRVVALNFASARNPGGGFLGGAKAQEEDLARCSALYPCLLTQRAYYDANRAELSLLYTDHIIYAPEVPFFRDDRLDLLDEPFLVSIITAPAPNAGEALRRDPGIQPQIRATLARRAEKILQVAAEQGHDTLVLGAWGCGVFRNNPREVADVFADLLQRPAFAHAFVRAVFAIYDRSKGQSTLQVFTERFG